MTIPAIFEDDSYFEILISGCTPIASGGFRYVYKVDVCEKSYAIKKSKKTPSANWREFSAYYYLIATNKIYKDYLGECYSISKTGQYLIMEWLNDLGQSEKIWTCPGLTDPKRENFGEASGTIKKRDYDQTDLNKCPTQPHKLPVDEKEIDNMQKWANVIKGIEP